jgi:hypothetical protein
MKSLGDAIYLRNHLIASLEEACRAGARRRDVIRNCSPVTA